MKELAFPLLALLLVGCGSSGTEPQPPDPEIEMARGSIWAELVPSPGYWHEEIAASAEVVGAEVGDERHRYDASFTFYYRILREAEHPAGPDTTGTITERFEKWRRGDGRVYGGNVERNTDLDGEWVLADSVVIRIEMQQHPTGDTVVVREFDDSRGGDGSLE